MPASAKTGLTANNVEVQWNYLDIYVKIVGFQALPQEASLYQLR